MENLALIYIWRGFFKLRIDAHEIDDEMGKIAHMKFMYSTVCI